MKTQKEIKKEYEGVDGFMVYDVIFLLPTVVVMRLVKPQPGAGLIACYRYIVEKMSDDDASVEFVSGYYANIFDCIADARVELEK